MPTHAGFYMNLPMETIKASELKAKCLQLMSEVAEPGDVIVITKNGHADGPAGPRHLTANHPIRCA
ncbi:MAG: type II toxin-antitoxin system Phd/YefM family antitoxin [Gammaproteobacteria bacterium]